MVRHPDSEEFEENSCLANRKVALARLVQQPSLHAVDGFAERAPGPDLAAFLAVSSDTGASCGLPW